MSSAFIALDWGTSSFRAYLLNKDGTVQETVTAPHGILAVKDGAFDAALESHIGKWDISIAHHGIGHDHQPPGLGGTALCRLPRKSAIHCGCGSSPHLETWPQNIFRSRYQLRAAPDGTPDVIRGEETQVLGCKRRRIEAFRNPRHPQQMDHCQRPGDHGLLLLHDRAKFLPFSKPIPFWES